MLVPDFVNFLVQKLFNALIILLNFIAFTMEKQTPTVISSKK